MQRQLTQSIQAQKALELVTQLQQRFVDALTSVGDGLGMVAGFEPIEWLRDGGVHGGGVRFSAEEGELFNRASVNVSQVHYDDDATKNLGSATAISTIIHPQNPHAPSVHIHISWTEMKDGSGYWRMMADLNPSIDGPWKDVYQKCIQDVTGDLYEEGAAQGDRYFHIPALERHRGVTHYYLEQYKTDSPEADFNFAQQFGEAVIDGYASILEQALAPQPAVSDEDRAGQLAYHTLYLFQVLTLDRGTTSGLLVHDQNDVGIMGSIPARVDRDLLASWAQRCEEPQNALVEALVAALDETTPSGVTVDVKLKLAQAVRSHYKANPQALAMQARGNVIPPTVSNHK